jgi:TRAP-type C4-dicarboxylate transport system permease small subunit
LLKSGAHIKVDVLNNLLAPRQLSILRLIIAVIALLLIHRLSCRRD